MGVPLRVVLFVPAFFCVAKKRPHKKRAPLPSLTLRQDLQHYFKVNNYRQIIEFGQKECQNTMVFKNTHKIGIIIAVHFAKINSAYSNLFDT
jgi:hypothetical protein